MKEVLKRVAPSLRANGFQGSGQHYRKREGDFVFVVNFQGSKWGGRFFVNLGAQPVFIPPEGNAELKKLKAHECVLRRRVGQDWPCQMSDEIFFMLESEILSVQEEFFGNAQTLRLALAADSPHDLLKKFSSGNTKARAILHLARAAATLEQMETAQKLIDLGKELANDGSVFYKAELENVLGRHVDKNASGVADHCMDCVPKITPKQT